ncbi:MAG TPA: TMEM175 family protein [Solirubrobacterales bacterium]|nr:TMEM175 family protein [Solirubrobacterales bacterium]
MTRREQAKRREENEVEFSRIVAFSDGVFAIAITLLVLNLSVDDFNRNDLWQGIWDQRENFLAYGISFAVIGRFWLVHHRFFSDVTAFDGRLLTLNMLYLAFIVLIPFSSQLLGDFGGETASVSFYAANLSACVLVGMWMFVDAQRAGLTAGESSREAIVRGLYIAGVFLVSIPIAFVAPSWAPLLWLVLFFDPADHVART